MEEYYSNAYAEEHDGNSSPHHGSEEVVDTAKVLEECLVKKASETLKFVTH
jgi:hypothetical protein